MSFEPLKIANGAPASLGDPQLIAGLEELLRAARAGLISGLGVVRVGADGVVSTAPFGTLMPIYFGCDLLQRQIMDGLTQKPSSIMRAR